MRVRTVKKRDGREAPFDPRKIEAAVGKAMAAVGEEDPFFASEVAAVVGMTLEQRYGALDGPLVAAPGIEEIQDLVEQALIELGRASVAKAYIVYRDRRARIREALEVHRSQAPAPRGAARARLRVVEAERASAWSKGRIVAALMREADLSREVAETVAARVEERVFASGLRRITTALVRELVDNELVTLGLDVALKRQATVGLPLYDLRAILQGSEAAPDPARPAAGETLAERGVETRAGGEVLRRFALQEVLGSDAVERHLSGDLFVLDLARPHLPLYVSLPAELLLGGAPSPAAAWELLAEVARLTQGCAHGVVLEEPEAVLEPLVLGARAERGDAALAAWLRTLAAISCAAGRRIDLALARGRSRSAITARLVSQLALLSDSPHAPRAFAGEDELEGLCAAGVAGLEHLLQSGRLVPTWDGDGERFAGPGCHRARGERGALECSGAVALNLPRLALRAGPWREDRVLESLAGLCASAAGALSDLARFQRGLRAARGDPRPLPFGRPSLAVAPVGLREALQCLGDGEVRPDQGARLLGLMADALRRLSEEGHAALVLTPFFGERAAARFAALDAELWQRSQRLLFDERAGAGLEPGAPYSNGFRLSPVAGFVPWAAETELVATVATGALLPLPEDRSRGGVLSIPEAWRCFRRLRRERPAFGERPAAPAPAPSLFEPPGFEAAGEPWERGAAKAGRAAARTGEEG